MGWPWSSPTQSDEDIKKKDYDVDSVRYEVGTLVKELKTVLDKIEQRMSNEGARRGSAPNH